MNTKNNSSNTALLKIKMVRNIYKFTVVDSILRVIYTNKPGTRLQEV